MTAQDPFDSQPASFDGPVFDDSLFKVRRAGRLKAAGLGQEWGNHSLVNVNKQNNQFLHNIT
jgi:hypothetical protein